MGNAFIIHGSNGSKDAHWYPWLKEKLKKRGLTVFLPQFPIKDKQTLSNWLSMLRPYKDKLDGAIIIAHSLGVPFVIDIFNQWNVECRAAFLVSGFTGHLEVENEPNLEDFAEKDYDWQKIRKSCNHFCVIHSDNDPYVPLDKAKQLAKNLNTDVTLVKGGEHFQAQSGFEEFDQLLVEIDKVIS